MSQTVHIALGANLGDRNAGIAAAIRRIGETEGIRVTRTSSVTETEPMSPPQPSYLNAAIEIECDLSPAELLAALKAIEKDMGRTPSRKWGPRVIDLDIIFFGDSVIDTEGLAVPHPGAAGRTFVLEPLAEIAPDKVHPVLRRTVSELLEVLRRQSRS